VFCMKNPKYHERGKDEFLTTVESADDEAEECCKDLSIVFKWNSCQVATKTIFNLIQKEFLRGLTMC